MEMRNDIQVLIATLRLRTAMKCFVGAWGFINSTLVNTTSGDIITQDWAYPVPSGMSLFTSNGYTALLVTANDTTRPDLRPQGLDQSNPSSSPDSEWAKIGKYSVAGAGPFRLSNLTDEKGPEGPEGVQTGTFLTSTIPARIGPYEFTFKFYNDCSAWNLHQDVGAGLQRVAWYYRLPDQDEEQDIYDQIRCRLSLVRLLRRLERAFNM